MISVVTICTGYKAITNVVQVTLHIVQSAVVDSEMVRRVKSADAPAQNTRAFEAIGLLFRVAT